jgi:hypothetical protein
LFDEQNGGMLDEYTLVIDSKKQRLSKIPKWIRKANQQPQTYLKGPKGGIYYYVSSNEVYYVPKVNQMRMGHIES